VPDRPGAKLPPLAVDMDGLSPLARIAPAPAIAPKAKAEQG